MPSVAADVAFGLAPLGLSEAEVRARVQRALEMVNLPEFADRPTHTLSGGQVSCMGTLLFSDDVRMNGAWVETFVFESKRT